MAQTDESANRDKRIDRIQINPETLNLRPKRDLGQSIIGKGQEIQDFSFRVI